MVLINWKLRIRNRATLITLIGTLVALVYQVLGIAGIVPAVSEETVINWVGLVINMLVALGVIIDPTTAGIGDSKRARGYEFPNDETDEIDEDEDANDPDLDDEIETEADEWA